MHPDPAPRTDADLPIETPPSWPLTSQAHAAMWRLLSGILERERADRRAAAEAADREGVAKC